MAAFKSIVRSLHPPLICRCRWDIEVFFKELKQTLQLSDFLGNSAHAIRWQIWCGLIVHLLLRRLHSLNQCATPFSASSPSYEPACGTRKICRNCSGSMGQHLRRRAGAPGPNRPTSRGSPEIPWDSNPADATEKRPLTDPLPNHIPEHPHENASKSGAFALPFCPCGMIVEKYFPHCGKKGPIFPHNGKTFRQCSTQWKKCFHSVENSV